MRKIFENEFCQQRDKALRLQKWNIDDVCSNGMKYTKIDEDDHIIVFCFCFYVNSYICSFVHLYRI